MIAFLAAISMAGIPIASTGVPRLQVVDIQNYPLPKLAFFACSSSDFDFILVSNDSDGRNLSITGAHGSAKPFRAPIIAILSNEYAGPTKDKWRLEMQASGGHAIKANVVLSIVNDI